MDSAEYGSDVDVDEEESEIKTRGPPPVSAEQSQADQEDNLREVFQPDRGSKRNALFKYLGTEVVLLALVAAVASALASERKEKDLEIELGLADCVLWFYFHHRAMIAYGETISGNHAGFPWIAEMVAFGVTALLGGAGIAFMVLATHPDPYLSVMIFTTTLIHVIIVFKSVYACSKPPQQTSL